MGGCVMAEVRVPAEAQRLAELIAAGNPGATVTREGDRLVVRATGTLRVQREMLRSAYPDVPETDQVFWNDRWLQLRYNRTGHILEADEDHFVVSDEPPPEGQMAWNVDISREVYDAATRACLWGVITKREFTRLAFATLVAQAREGPVEMLPVEAGAGTASWNVKLPPDVYREAAAAAEALGLTKRAFTEQALLHYCRKLAQ